ncbi:PDGLE domain-containing protein [Actinocorallia populi]|uniref:PDGLE domain-containing protein n=1 Tax=Actinocorallia populi TaxID=2079200 RepID=UPI0018E568DE|nr:PDGLE domain-containing protein [Actinocorallia populi]
MSLRRLLALGVLVAAVLAGIVSYYASSHPDGLERVAEDKGFNAEEKDHALGDSPLADYGVKGVADERASVGLSGIIGVGVVLVAGTGLFWMLRGRPDGGGEPAEPAGKTRA